MLISPLLQVFNAILPLSQTEMDDFAQIIDQEKLSKGQFWIKENKVNKKIGFILNGYLRKFYVSNDGNEMTDYFYFASDFCTDLPSIIGKTKPSSNVVAMEETSLITFPYSDFDELRKRYPNFERIYTV